jgi:RHS repeat-associated protein
MRLSKLFFCRIVFGLLALAILTAHHQAFAASETILWNFGYGSDGQEPLAGLIMDGSGNLYGTTKTGGSGIYGVGTVFRLTPSPTSKGSWSESILWNFGTSEVGASAPLANLIMDASGNLYGTTLYGGAYQTNPPIVMPGFDAGGTIFKLNGGESTLWNFGNGTDGQFPSAGLVIDTSGNLYGTTVYGGAFSPQGGGYNYLSPFELDIATGLGVAFKLTPQGQESILWNFGSGNDGAYPTAGLIMDNSSDLYGTTAYGGSYGGGTVFKLTPQGQESILWNFGSGIDGNSPAGGLIMDKSGNFYGTTYGGGAYGAGTVFELTPEGEESILWNFGYGTDGQDPIAGLIMDSSGNLYGTTSQGGPWGLNYGTGGTVFKLIQPSTSGAHWSESVLWDFGSGNDGIEPVGGLIMDSSGNLYGTTSYGGTWYNNGSYGGIVFQISNVSGNEKGLGFPCDTAGSPFCGDPITIGNGNVFEPVTDYETDGSNKLSFSRYYNSQSSSNIFAVALGRNWSSTYDRYLQLTLSGSVVTGVTAERADGRMLNFTLNDGVWTPDSDVDITLTNSGTTWMLTDHDDTVERYTTNSAGNEGVLNSITARDGYKQTLGYNSNSQLTSVTDSYHRALSFTYTGNLLHKVASPDGLVLTYGYNSSGVTPGVNDRLASVSYSTSPVAKQSYVYTNSALPFALTGIVDEDGHRYATWTYDSSGRGLTSQHGINVDLTKVSYATNGNRTVTNALGEQTVYKFTTLQGVPKVTEISRLASATTAAATESFTYDANGYTASAADWNGRLTDYTNDAHGNPLIIDEAVGTSQARTTTITYDPVFVHLPDQIVTAGLTTSFTYDSSGDPLTKSLIDTTTSQNNTRTWTCTWSNFLMSSVKTPRTDVSGLTQFSHDSTGALTGTTNALGQTTQITEHLPGGLPQTVIDPNGVVTNLTYDPRLRLLSSAVTTTAGVLTTTFVYDPAGNLTEVIQPDGSALTDAYDTAHRLISVTDLFNQSTAYTLDGLGDRTLTQVSNSAKTVEQQHSGVFDALGRVLQDIGGVGQTTQYSYDNNGNALTVTDPLAHVTEQAFDALNRLTRVTQPSPVGGNIVTTYDAHDRPLTVTNPNGGVTTYVYDGFGDVLQQTSPDSGITLYQYDADSNLTQKTDATGAVINYTYDALDRVLTASYPSDLAEDVIYTYDESGYGFGIGRLTSVADEAGALSRSYDERGNIVNETRQTSLAPLSTSYVYDAASRITAITYPSAGVVSYTRDIMGRVTAISATKTGSSTPLPVLANVSYEPFGPVSALTFGNGVAETRSFDLDYRMLSLADAGSTTLQNLGYSYDAANNVLSITDGVTSGNSQALGYDALNRLTGATGAYGNLGYTYDEVGNVLSQVAGSSTTTYKYASQSNRLVQIVNAATTQAVGTSSAGNITSFTPAMGLLNTLAYNQAGRLATVTGTATPAQYIYDAFGQRLEKGISGTTLYGYDLSGHLLEERLGIAITDYIYLDGRPVATLTPTSGTLSFLHDDRLGAPQLASNSQQATVWQATYQPYGSANVSVAVVTQNLRLPGQYFDAESGLHQNGLRDYNPGFGRYVESDPIGLAGGIDTYAYVGGNPLTRFDPLGQSSFGDVYLKIASFLRQAISNAFGEVGGAATDVVGIATTAVVTATYICNINSRQEAYDQTLYDIANSSGPTAGITIGSDIDNLNSQNNAVYQSGITTSLGLGAQQ